MRKTVALLAFTVPYLRAPLCQAGSHEHPEAVGRQEGHASHAMSGGRETLHTMEGGGHPGHGMGGEHTKVAMEGGEDVGGLLGPEARSPDARDCHEKMLCAAAVDLVVLPSLGGDDVRAGLLSGARAIPTVHPDVSLRLDLPPPRRI